MKVRLVWMMLVLSLISTSCNPFGAFAKRWSVEVTGYDVVRRVDTGSAVSGVLEEEDGVAWLYLFVSLTNRSDEPYKIEWEEDAFVFADDEGVTRAEVLEYAGLSGYLDREFDPGETNEGFIVFRVDPEVRVPEGTLTWKPSRGNLVTVELDGVPEREIEK